MISKKNTRIINSAERKVSKDVCAIANARPDYQRDSIVLLAAAIEQRGKAMSAERWSGRIAIAGSIVALITIIASGIMGAMGISLPATLIEVLLLACVIGSAVLLVISRNAEDVFPYAKRANRLAALFANAEPAISKNVTMGPGTFHIYDMHRWYKAMLAKRG